MSLNMRFNPLDPDEDHDFFLPVRDGADAAVIQRLSSAPSRYVHYVDVGEADPQRVDRILRVLKIRMFLARLKHLFDDGEPPAAVPVT